MAVFPNLFLAYYPKLHTDVGSLPPLQLYTNNIFTEIPIIYICGIYFGCTPN